MTTTTATTAANAASTLSSVINTTTGANNNTSASAAAASTTSSTGTSSTTPATDATTLGSNFNTFLTLLTTQLQNQDPLSPLDSAQFTQQLVEFSQVEQQINTNTNLNSLISLQEQNDTLSAQTLVGKTVEINSANAPLADDQASYSYTLPATAASTTLAITNSQGAVVWSGSGETASGSHNFTWDGEDLNGDSVSAGTYTLNVVATGASGATITPTISSYGTVDSVTNTGGTTNLSIGGTSYPLSQFMGIQATSS